MMNNLKWLFLLTYLKRFVLNNHSKVRIQYLQLFFANPSIQAHVFTHYQ